MTNFTKSELIDLLEDVRDALAADDVERAEELVGLDDDDEADDNDDDDDEDPDVEPMIVDGEDA